jgi:uncharacterized protein
MSKRDTYPPGVPCWVDVGAHDVRGALSFYSEVFGWEFKGPGLMPDHSGQYFVATREGDDIAGVGSLPLDTLPDWKTYIAVASVHDTAGQASAAGGEVLVPPFEAPPAGRMAVLADSTGAVFAIWEAGERQGAQRINEPGAWAMSVLNTTDPDRAATFYRDLFRWNTEGEGFSLCRLPGYVGGEPEQPVPRDVIAVMLAAENGAESHWSVGFWVDDVDATADTASRIGGEVLVPPNDTEIARQAVLADPEGAAFSVSKVRKP